MNTKYKRELLRIQKTIENHGIECTIIGYKVVSTEPKINGRYQYTSHSTINAVMFWLGY